MSERRGAEQQSQQQRLVDEDEDEDRSMVDEDQQDEEEAGSTYSTDSFVDDHFLHRSDGRNLHELKGDPSSSPSPPPPPQQPPPPESIVSEGSQPSEDLLRIRFSPRGIQQTIELTNATTTTTPRHRTLSSDSLAAAHIAPAHPFFSASFYEQDGDSGLSDGSLVFLDHHPHNQHQQQPTSSSLQQQTHPPPHAAPPPSGGLGLGASVLPAAAEVSQPPGRVGPSRRPGSGTVHNQHHHRERFPSFDSAGSTGSFRFVSPRPAPPSLGGGGGAGPTPTYPHMLPYHERRKLMQQRMQQQQQQQGPQPAFASMHPTSGIPFTHPSPLPFGAEAASGMFSTMGAPPAANARHGMAPGPQPTNLYPLHPAFGVLPGPPPPPPHFAQQPPSQPPRNAKTDGGGFLRPPLRVPPPSYYPQPYPNLGASTTENNTPHQQQHPLGATPTPHLDAPGRSDSGTTTSLRSSSSSGHEPGARSSQRHQSSQQAPPPPPPPPSVPPPPLKAAHVRQDSAGSVSSLGSMDRSSSRDDDGTESDAGGRPRPAGIQPVSAAVASQKTHAVHDFHRKNQEFLSRLEPRQSIPPASPVVSVHKTAARPSRTTLGPPPTNNQIHRRLPSIDNDEWSDEDDVGGAASGLSRSSQDVMGKVRSARLAVRTATREPVQSNHRALQRERGLVGPHSSSSEEDYENYSSDGADFHETSKLLPPSGISSNEMEGYGSSYLYAQRRPPVNVTLASQYNASGSREMHAAALLEYQRAKESRSRRKRKKARSRTGSSRRRDSRLRRRDDDSPSSSSVSSQDDRQWMSKKALKLEHERLRLVQQWRAEAMADDNSEGELRLWCDRLCGKLHAFSRTYIGNMNQSLVWLQEFFANLPLTIGAIALAIANLGVDWFKFTEENLSSCEPVHFHSSQCSFPEFPGCFYCDTNVAMYKFALRFHWVCSSIAGLLALTFLTKLCVAWPIAFDELSSPTTATPAGLICMTLDVVFAGRGFPGMCIVLASSCVHLCLTIWFIYMALAYHLLPEPSFFPNTVGIGISAIKTWLYFPAAGHFLMAISLCLNIFFFPISLIRVALNKKISAPVGWMQMSAPNISLYALTIMAQPSFEEEHPDVTDFQKVHRLVYLPCMHFLFALCIIGMIASVSSLVVRWHEFRKTPFSPAHAAFCCPTLSHANAVQAYRAAVNSFSELPPDHPFRALLYVYWIIVLSVGTALTLTIATKFIWCLPQWTHINVDGEVEPPAPNETAMTLTNAISSGDALVQPFVSPAILQANETGALVLTHTESGQHVYVRTRQVTSLGFEPILDSISLQNERALLLQHCSVHPPRRRHRTLSVPGIDFTYGSGNWVTSYPTYGSPDNHSLPTGRKRASSSVSHVGARRNQGN